jgi:hypothetical protein
MRNSLLRIESELTGRGLGRWKPLKIRARREERGEAMSERTGKELTAGDLTSTLAGGLTLAVWHTRDNYLKTVAVKWAEEEDAVGFSKGTTLAFGKALPGDKKLHEILSDVTKAMEALAGAGKAVPKIQTIALFTHGTSTWVGIGDGIESTTVGSTVKDMAPYLADNAVIIIYGCSSGRGASEPDDWYKTTMTDGGSDGLAGKFRDALLAEGKKRACVWGHTEVGHTTSNFTLRVFRAWDGAGSAGKSFVKTWVLDWQGTIVDDLKAEVLAQGYDLPAAKEAKFRSAAEDTLRVALYRVYAATHKDKTLDGRNLAEVTPLRPSDVAAIVTKEWETKWAAKKSDWAKEAATNARLSKKTATSKSFEAVWAMGAPTSLKLRETHPDKGEADTVGAMKKKIKRGTAEFSALVENTNADIEFKDEEQTGADRMMTRCLQQKLDALAALIKKEWPSLKLRVTEAWDENDEHHGASLHYEGRAADITTSDKDGAKLGRLAGLAIEAGLDWVFFEDEKHVHVSVVRD